MFLSAYKIEKWMEKNSNLLWTDDIIIFTKIDFLKNLGLQFLISVINGEESI